MTRRLNRKGLSSAWRNRYIQINRIRGNAIDGTSFSPEVPADHAHMGAVVIRDFRYLGSLNLLITRLGHFERRGQVSPELKPVHASCMVALRHLLMNNAAARGHPLHVPGPYDATVAHAVPMLHGSSQH